ncbi:MAG: adenosylcobinamide-GDP ribazoletransferase [Methanomicrobiaceae archaeon]|nr:adenosylcobinamide-GDP ribazoletransferase [Methanomicrobiaceae archaeon]
MKAVRALLQFTTILPLGRGVDFDAFARHSYIYPLAGYVIGAIAAILAYLMPERALGAGVAVAVVILLSGCHHFDGLLDFGDGLMVHGDRTRRIAALSDRLTGTGGIALGLLVTLLSFSGLLSVASIPWTILAAEVLAKGSMAVLTVTGTPFKEGMHRYLHGFARPWFLPASIMLCLPVLLFPLGQWGIAASFTALLLTVIFLLSLSRHLFGGVNGDIVGAANEITRMTVIVALAIAT